MDDDAAGRLQSLSCVNCRKRKVKCSRLYPCEQCTRQELQCEFPVRRRLRKPRLPRNNELLGRLARLEEIVGKVDPTALATVKQQATRPGQDKPEIDPEIGARHEVDVSSHTNDGQLDPDDGHHGGPSGKYLSSDFWMNLGAEVDGIKQILEQTSDESDEDEIASHSTPESLGHASSSHPSSSRGDVSAAILGNSAEFASETLQHPPPEQIRVLCSTYFSNVDLVLKVLHRPTVSHLLESYAASPKMTMLDKPSEALCFAIYFGAISSLNAQACLARLGQERSLLVPRYRAAVELALARADYLNSDRLESLQAFTIYAACLRSHKESKASWALLSLAVRLAHGFGLHKDGDGSALSPYDAEMRRRLWWALVILDIRAVEDRGSEAIIAPESYDTQLPTNINDDDFGPATAAPLVGREGATDVTFNICTAMSSGFHLYLCDPKPLRGPHPGRSSVIRVPQTEEDIVKHVQELEARFVERVDRTHLSSMLAAVVTRLIILKVWLMIQYPFHQVRPGATRPHISRENLLRTAISILELEDAGQHVPQAERWNWWVETYPQWHPLAVALSELCTQTEGETADRAWRLIDVKFPHWSETIADTKRGTLWRPIRKLWKKARAARMDAKMDRLGIGTGPPTMMSLGDVPSSKAPGQHGEVAQGRDVAVVLDTASNSPNNPDWFSSADFLQDPAEWFPGETAEAYMDIGQDAMDWTTWNEFVNDTFAGASTSPSDN